MTGPFLLISEGAKRVIKGFQVLFGRGPAGGQAEDGVSLVELFPETNGHYVLQFLCPFIRQDDELLVRGRRQVDLDAMFLEDGFQFFRLLDGVFPDAEVQVLREECVELDAEESPLREKRTSLLDERHEVVWLVVLCEDDRFAAEGAAFGAADVEDVAEFCDVRERHVGLFAREAVCQTGAVQVESGVPTGTSAGAIDISESFTFSPVPLSIQIVM